MLCYFWLPNNDFFASDESLSVCSAETKGIFFSSIYIFWSSVSAHHVLSSSSISSRMSWKVGWGCSFALPRCLVVQIFNFRSQRIDCVLLLLVQQLDDWFRKIVQVLFTLFNLFDLVNVLLIFFRFSKKKNLNKICEDYLEEG